MVRARMMSIGYCVQIRSIDRHNDDRRGKLLVRSSKLRFWQRVTMRDWNGRVEGI